MKSPEEAASQVKSGGLASPGVRPRHEKLPKGHSGHRRPPKFGAFNLHAFFDARQALLLDLGAFSTGILAYFSLPREPELWALGLLVALALILRRVLSPFGYRRDINRLWIFFTLGPLLASVHVALLATPMLPKAADYVNLRGWIEKSEALERGGTRLTLKVQSLRSDRVTAPLERVTVTSRQKGLPPDGELVRLRANLLSPPEPVQPKAYDPALRYYFRGVGATGYATSKITKQVQEGRPFWLGIKLEVQAWRQAYSKRLQSQVSGKSGALIAALITGDRSGLNSEDRTALRRAGLAHILSISGLHMVLISGTFYWLVRALLALFPSLALRYNIKAWAALAGLFGAVTYLVISGAAVPTVRAFIMVSIGFIAILWGRRALSLRNIALAALLILALSPEQILAPGFQMSFAATIALIGFYEKREPRDEHFSPFLWLRILDKVWRYFRGIVGTTMIASAATLPLAAYHFGTFTSVGLLGNLLALPIFGLLVMPAAVVAMMLTPFGLEGLALEVMGLGASLILEVAYGVSALPGANILIPSFSGYAILSLALAGFTLLVLYKHWRWLSLVPLSLALVFIFQSNTPSILVSASGKTVMVRGEDGRLQASYISRGEQFLRKRWLAHDGDDREWRAAQKNSEFHCTEQFCTIGTESGERLVHLLQEEAREAACAAGRVLVATSPVPCSGDVLVLHPGNLKQGSVELSRAKGAWQVTPSLDNWHRPWTSYRAP